MASSLQQVQRIMLDILSRYKVVVLPIRKRLLTLMLGVLGNHAYIMEISRSDLQFLSLPKPSFQLSQFPLEQ
jgi:hypothetical protein